ncbi:hypothetical protein LIER_01887 [Lithospermum erythrorhizon]|uniref:Uncharacterized protein n=1 Tax=Lithospermum erythrorhizon TaxID=34254 RepID=A0AAV3NNU0_LITER
MPSSTLSPKLTYKAYWSKALRNLLKGHRISKSAKNAYKIYHINFKVEEAVLRKEAVAVSREVVAKEEVKEKEVKLLELAVEQAAMGKTRVMD